MPPACPSNRGNLRKSKVERVPLGSVAEIDRQIVEPAAATVPEICLSLEDIDAVSGVVRIPPARALAKSSKFRFSPVHVLYGKLRPYLRKVARPETAGICSTDILPIKPHERLDRDYLFHFLRTPEFTAWATQAAVGVNLPRLSPSLLSTFDIPLPPLPSQQRIAAVLDAAEALRAKRRAALVELDTLTQAIFLDMFGDAEANPKKWPVCAVADYVHAFQGGKSIESESDENAVTRNRVLKVSAVTGMKFLAHESKPVPDSYAPPKEHFAQPGDLLFSRANTTELVGAVAFVESTPPNVLLPDKLWRFVWRDPAAIEPLFVWALFQTPTVRREIGRRATGTSGSMKNISQEKVFGIRTILPPLSLQREFADRVGAMERLKAVQRAGLAELEALFASLQHRAFRGEL